MGTSVLHIKTEVECLVYLFDKEKGDDCFCSVFKHFCSTHNSNRLCFILL